MTAQPVNNKLYQFVSGARADRSAGVARCMRVPRLYITGAWVRKGVEEKRLWLRASWSFERIRNRNKSAASNRYYFRRCGLQDFSLKTNAFSNGTRNRAILQTYSNDDISLLWKLYVFLRCILFVLFPDVILNRLLRTTLIRRIHPQDESKFSLLIFVHGEGDEEEEEEEYKNRGDLKADA